MAKLMRYMVKCQPFGYSGANLRLLADTSCIPPSRSGPLWPVVPKLTRVATVIKTSNHRLFVQCVLSFNAFRQASCI